MRNSTWRLSILTAAGTAVAFLLSACMSGAPREPRVDPDAARARIEQLLPANVPSRAGWAVDIFTAMEALKIAPSPENICAVVAVTEQESTFQENPRVPGLAAIARKEIDAKAAAYGIPKAVMGAALELRSPDGASYRERLDRANTEKALSEIFEDFISMVPLGERLFGDLNPVRTGGPMQVSIAYAEEHAAAKRYPYPVSGDIRDEVFTRRGGMYFGIAHLLDYKVSYDDMLYRFADFNAGHYASRNAGFQNAVNIVAKTKLSLDGDLLLHGRRASEPSNTELAVRKLADRLQLSEAQIRRDLERGADESFGASKLHERLFALADEARGRPAPRAVVPRILLQSPKIQRKLTTEWFARRVDGRYEKCLQRANPKTKTKKS
jgi:hypothetical protein